MVSYFFSLIVWLCAMHYICILHKIHNIPGEKIYLALQFTWSLGGCEKRKKNFISECFEKLNYTKSNESSWKSGNKERMKHEAQVKWAQQWINNDEMNEKRKNFITITTKYIYYVYLIIHSRCRNWNITHLAHTSVWYDFQM